MVELGPLSMEALTDVCPDIIAVHDEKDPTSIPKTVRERAKQLTEDQVSKYTPSSIAFARSPLNGLRIGIPKVNLCSIRFINL